jgi:hypothetical protein
VNDRAIDWPSAVVATAILTLIGAVTIAGIIKYPTTTEALEIWSTLTPLVGLITGAFVTYFFTRGEIQTAQEQAKEARLLASRQQQQAAITQQALVRVAGALEPSKWDEMLRSEPTLWVAMGASEVFEARAPG